MKTKKGTRTAALTCLLAVMAVTALTVFYWDALLVRYHLHRLESEPDRLMTLCQMEEPPPSVARAVELYTQTEEGMNRLFLCCLTVASKYSLLPLAQKGLRELLVYPSADNAVSQAYNERVDTRTYDAASLSLERVNRFTSCLLGKSFASEEFPGQRFTFITESEVPPDLQFARPDYSDVPVLLLVHVEPREP